MNDAEQARVRRLRWRARRGLLENDIVLARYFDANEGRLGERQITGLDVLLDLTDRELLDLILGRSEPSGEADRSESREVLEDLRKI
jgi:antitoxin CptB